MGESQPDQIRPVRKNMVFVEKAKKDLKRFGRMFINSRAQ